MFSTIYSRIMRCGRNNKTRSRSYNRISWKRERNKKFPIGILPTKRETRTSKCTRSRISLGSPRLACLTMTLCLLPWVEDELGEPQTNSLLGDSISMQTPQGSILPLLHWKKFKKTSPPRHTCSWACFKLQLHSDDDVHLLSQCVNLSVWKLLCKFLTLT